MTKKIFILFLTLQVFISIPVLSNNNSEKQSISKTNSSSNEKEYPVFNDPVVQKYVDDYRVLFQNLIIAAEKSDIKNLKKLNIQTEKMSSKSMDIKRRLAADSTEEQKFYDELTKKSKEYDNEMLRLVEKISKKK